MPEIVQSAGLVVFRRQPDRAPSEPLYLMLHSSRKQHRWTPPKGHLEPDESLLECALRETREESGITQLRLVEAFAPREVVYQCSAKCGGVGDKLKCINFWLAEVTADPVTLSHEHRDYRWCNHAEAVELAQRGFPEVLPLLHEAHRFIITSCQPPAS